MDVAEHHVQVHRRDIVQADAFRAADVAMPSSREHGFEERAQGEKQRGRRVDIFSGQRETRAAHDIGATGDAQEFREVLLALAVKHVHLE